MDSIDTLLNDAVAVHQRGDFAAAAEGYRRVLAVDPKQPTALHHLGIIELSANRLESARALLIAATQAAPAAAGPWLHLGELAQRQGNIDQSAAAYAKAIELQPDFLVALQSLGALLLEHGRAGEALPSLRKLTSLAPNLSGGFLLLGQALIQTGQTEEAIATLQQTVRLAPTAPAGHFNLGQVLWLARRLPQAEAALTRSLELNESNADAHTILATALESLGKPGPASKHFRRAAELQPDSAGALLRYAVALRRSGKLAAAEAQLRRALELEPTNAFAMGNLGNVFRGQCRQAEGLEMYRKAVQTDPNLVGAWNMLIYSMHFDPQADDAAIAAVQKDWNRKFAAELPAVAKFDSRDRNPDRRLRLGYVSCDLREHVVGRFLEQIARSHNLNRFELFAYSDVTSTDAATQRMRPLFGVWRDTASLNDQKLAEQIATDQIDILVDVSGHLQGNRLLAFARRPAPVQITHIAYPASPGLDAIRFRITDRHLDPPGSQPPGNEILLRLPNSYYLYNPFADTPDPAGPPSRTGGPLTFGSLNATVKITDRAVELWSAVLQRFPNSRMMLIVSPDGSANGPIAEMFARFGIPESRLILQPPCAKMEEYFSLYHGIDIALDPLPYGGGITGCDTLWMGVPVVTRVGPTSVGRIGTSLLRTLGLGELVAESDPRFVQIVNALVEDPQKLLRLRFELRQRMLESPLMDGDRYARDIEALYLQAWQSWCDGKG